MSSATLSEISDYLHRRFIVFDYENELDLWCMLAVLKWWFLSYAEMIQWSMQQRWTIHCV